MSLIAGIVLTSVLAWAVVWATLGRTAWWIPAFAFSFVGGFINLGFKVYPHEIGLALSLAAVVPIMAANPRRLANRPPLDWSVYLLIVYMLIHLAVSCYLAIAAGMPGTGTIVRHYVGGLWALTFVALFWAYGDLRHFRIALTMATVFCIIRVSLGVLGLYRPETITTQGGGVFFFMPVTAMPTGLDLRVSAPALMALLTVWFYQRSGASARAITGVAYVGAIWLTLLGASRVAALSVIVIPLMWAIVQRQRVLLLVGVATVAAMLVALNYSPGFYRSLPDGARRSLFAFVVSDDVRHVEAYDTTSSSNSWHFRLLESGLSRWTEGLASFTFGNRVEGWHAEYAGFSTLDKMADVAVRLAAYENALCTVAATLGLVGLLLFTRALYWLYRPFARDILRDGIRSQDDALAFIALQSLIVYVGLCWIAGGYPSVQMVLGVLAAVAWCERGVASRNA